MSSLDLKNINLVKNERFLRKTPEVKLDRFGSLDFTSVVQYNIFFKFFFFFAGL